MESWEHYNYYTYNPSGWVELLNLSTAEWGIGYLPPSVIAINRTVNDADHFPPDAFVIQNAAIGTFLSRDVEKVVFGATSGLVILWAFCWVAFQCYRNSLFSPRKLTASNSGNSANSVFSHDTDATQIELANLGSGNTKFLKAEEFKQQLHNFYYEPVATELELYEKDFVKEDVSAADVETVTELLRKMYDLDLGLWAEQNSHTTEWEMNQFRLKSDAALAEVRHLVTSWTSRNRTPSWTEEEAVHLRSVLQVLADLPEKRYGNLGQ